MQQTDYPQSVEHPCECPNCGSAIEYAVTEDNRSITLCKGSCGIWCYIND